MTRHRAAVVVVAAVVVAAVVVATVVVVFVVVVGLRPVEDLLPFRKHPDNSSLEIQY